MSISKLGAGEPKLRAVLGLSGMCGANDVYQIVDANGRHFASGLSTDAAHFVVEACNSFASLSAMNEQLLARIAELEGK